MAQPKSTLNGLPTIKGGDSMLSSQQKDMIVILSKNEHLNNVQISAKVGVARASVIKVLKSNWTINSQFLDTYNKNVQENNESLLEMIKSVRYQDIVSDVLSIFTLENLKAEFDTRGLRSLIALQGNAFDKGMAYERLDLDKRKVNIAERTLELKEQELQARIDNPDAFAAITIINDSEAVDSWYDKNGTNTAYSKN